MGYVGLDHVLVEGDIVRNKYWVGLLCALSDREFLVDLYLINL